MKIHIFYRHFNIQGNDRKNRPICFDFEKCFINLISTIENKNIDLHVIMDGDIESNFVSKYKDKFISHQIKAGTDQSSFFQTWNIVKEIEIGDTDLIYFLENDYLHVHGWHEKIIDLFNTYDGYVGYVSLYDCLDKYTSPDYTDLVSHIYVTKTSHWRTTPSTCGSFIINKQLFDADYDIHTTFVGDHHKFLWLSKNRGRLVLSPIPSLSTHNVSNLMAPLIDWDTI
jgi:hypothetical protein